MKLALRSAYKEAIESATDEEGWIDKILEVLDRSYAGGYITCEAERIQNSSILTKEDLLEFIEYDIWY